MIPDLSLPENLSRWRALEAAKHRLFYTLFQLRLPVETQAESPAGLAFQFLADVGPGAPSVMTGHADGVITINLAEADDAERERRRQQMGELYRTLLGHFRHEIGHYYWDRLIANTPHLEEFRRIFGDERQDYDPPRCRITMPTARRRTGRSISSQLTRARTPGRTSPKPGLTIFT